MLSLDSLAMVLVITIDVFDGLLSNSAIENGNGLFDFFYLFFSAVIIAVIFFDFFGTRFS